jgi:PP-loop superfamily ATP-utilizing enzyme
MTAVADDAPLFLKRRLAISFSGGRTSAYMTRLLLDAAKAEGVEPVVIFANTGQEHEATLRFVRSCDEEFGFNTVWIEAAVNPERGHGTSFKVVDFFSASRDGEPFEAVIAKYGIPNQNFPHCTRETKERPITAYLRSLGWQAGSYKIAIGIRADEADRQSPSAKGRGIVYPLIRAGIRKSDVLNWWNRQAFDLNLEEHQGNCKACWKKSLRKLMTIAEVDPGSFEWVSRMEAKYHDAGPGDMDRPRRFFRGNRTAEDIIELAREPFKPYRPETEFQIEMDMLDLGGGCGDSCEVFADDVMEAAE